MDTTVADPLVGQTLDGRYRVESRIARGGMATVYLAHDVKLERTVALKVMHANLAGDDDFVRRFIGEAKAAAALSHPNVVAVYDQGTDRGHVFLAMEYVPGRTLRDLLAERGRLGPREALGIMQPVLAGLGAAHRAGLMHRDVKAENVLLTGDGQVKVVDFGLARAVAATQHTKTGMVIGTVGYLAPEQVVSGVSDARSDVYAAGILLFELLTGQQPHRGETPLAVAYKHVNEVVPLPSSVVPGLPHQLDAIVAAATNHDPGRRPPDAGHFLGAVAEVHRLLPADIDRALAASPVLPPVQGPPVQGPPVQGPPATGRPHPTGHILPPPDQMMRHGSHTMVVPRLELPGRRPFTERLSGVLTHRNTLIALGALAVVVLAWAVWYQTAGRYTTVPAGLAGMPVAEAEATVESKGLVVKLGTEKYSATVEKGKVIAVSPEPGTRIEKGETITLVPSKGPSPVVVPDVTGKPVAAAKQLLVSKGLTPGTDDKKEFSTTVPKGSVIRTDPPAGEKQAREDPVTLIVSAGIKLPDMVGWQRAQAEQTLREMGLNPLVEEREDAAQPPGTVLVMNPKEGTGVEQGAEIRLIVAKPKGNCPWWNPLCNNGDQGPEIVAVPDVQGRTVKEARKILEQAGFKVHVKRGTGGNVIRAQNPTGQAPRGSKVTVWR